MDTNVVRLVLVLVGMLALTLALFLPVDLKLMFGMIDAIFGINDIVRWAIGFTGVAIALGAVTQFKR